MSFKYKRRYNKKSYAKKVKPMKRKYRKARTTESIVRSPNGFPDRYITSCRSHLTASFYTTISSSIAANLLPNSVYQPFGGLSSAYAAYNQTLSLVYNKYIVKFAKITIKFVQNSANPCYVVGYPNNIYGSTSSNYDLAIEQPYSRHTILEANTAGTDQIKTLTWTLDLAKIVGRSRDEYNKSDNFSALTGANPSDSIALVLQAFDMIAGITSIFILLDITIEQDVEFYEKKQITSTI